MTSEAEKPEFWEKVLLNVGRVGGYSQCLCKKSINYSIRFALCLHRLPVLLLFRGKRVLPLNHKASKEWLLK
jgi:hypothetical protein